MSASTGIFSSTWGATAYLPMVGPAQLRFLPPMMPKPRNFALSVPLPPPPAEPLPVAKPEPPVVTVVLPPSAHDQPSDLDQIGDIIDVTSSSDVISTKTLLKYFNRSANGNSTVSKVPFQFIPPPPSQPDKAGSSAPRR